MSCLMRYTLGVFHQDHDQDHAVLDVGCFGSIPFDSFERLILLIP